MEYLTIFFRNMMTFVLRNTHEAIQSIALMNIKKSGGQGQADQTIIMEHLEKNLVFLHRQIEIIAPDIIITGISWSKLRNELFPESELEKKWRKSGYGVDIAKYKNAKVIDFYHPSARIPPSASYSLLQNIIHAKQFQEL